MAANLLVRTPDARRDHSRRKDAHLDLCATEEVAPAENATLLECVRLVHCAMPELAFSEVDLTTVLFGKKLTAPLMLTGMTGGTERAGQVNRELAQVAEEFGVAFGVGSQRAMAERPELTSTFAVRDVAPTTVMVGNIGLVQAAALGLDAVRRMVDAIGADALALHLNPGAGAQPARRRSRLPRRLRHGDGPGEGLRRSAAGERDRLRHLAGRGAAAGEGGRAAPSTSLGWAAPRGCASEQLRSRGAARGRRAVLRLGHSHGGGRRLGAQGVGVGTTLVASGGLRTGLDVAKALALGADLGGMALPLFGVGHRRSSRSAGGAGRHLAGWRRPWCWRCANAGRASRATASDHGGIEGLAPSGVGLVSGGRTWRTW